MKRMMKFMVKQIGCIKAICGILGCLLILNGCSNNIREDKQIILKDEKTEESETEINNNLPEADTETIFEDASSEPKITEADWSGYFDGFNGAAVIYNPSNMEYTIFNSEAALTKRSPCSTFKIISSLIALESGIIQPGNSIRAWSGEAFWNEDWNHDIDFDEAFRKSCVWYFRQVIDDIGPDIMQKELEKLQYGNCDISDWEGRMNTNNNNRALTGFWIESSLLISPKEQTEVMERIFGMDSVYSKDTQNKLKQVMSIAEQYDTNIPLYGKTGMGMAYGVVVDAWFTGFAEGTQGNVYFCVYLGRTEDKEVSSTAAKEIAVQLVSEYCNYLTEN